MTLLCALDDFLVRTLAYVSGNWGKLRYISGLRAQDGQYIHWGLTRKYGENAAQRAIEEAHRNVLIDLLRTPVRELISDAQSSASAVDQPLVQYLQEVSRDSEGLLPRRAGSAATSHFSAVVQALARLTQARKDSSHRVS